MVSQINTRKDTQIQSVRQTAQRGGQVIVIKPDDAGWISLVGELRHRGYPTSSQAVIVACRHSIRAIDPEGQIWCVVWDKM